ncbi:NAD(P)-dependent oxidoreductase [Arthrobacter rhombi]|uniref:Rrf2-linked NADH-flavin reductase n=1 Tax=Arthrobacter rhombi TaxID=71253 RepID=A0A1R4FQU7_9MICC|nr:NAD(P)H-binding protein [Arthrobacter rhombi]SJM58306.1 Rrf2-linked NADH-flavin reductase [Arthrobacter rhombi]
MNITILGSTGMVGSELVLESARRGHHVFAGSRRATAHQNPAVTVFGVDAGSSAQLASALAGSDIVMLAIRPDHRNEQSTASVTGTVLEAAAVEGAPVLVAGGAGPLRSMDDPLRLVVDDPRYVGRSWRGVALASVVQLETCLRHENQRWTYASPPAVLEHGQRTGSYRRGTTTLLVAPDGSSWITVEDFAVAMLDEIESPGEDRHFTVAQSLDHVAGSGHANHR